MDLSSISPNSLIGLGACLIVGYSQFYTFKTLMPQRDRVFAATVAHIEQSHKADVELLKSAIDANSAALKTTTEQTGVLIKAVTDLADRQVEQMDALTAQIKLLTGAVAQLAERQLTIASALNPPTLARSSSFDRASLTSLFKEHLKTDEGDQQASELIAKLLQMVGTDAIAS